MLSFDGRGACKRLGGKLLIAHRPTSEPEREMVSASTLVRRTARDRLRAEDLLLDQPLR
jgi:hypothetical protein